MADGAVADGSEAARPGESFDTMDNVTWEELVSHQLRTPLCVMTAELDRARRLDPDAMRRSIQRLLRLIDQLHLAGLCRRQGRLRAGPSCLADAARRVCIRLAPIALDRDQALAFRDFGGGASTLLDRPLAEEAICNLVENAIKYAPSGSRIDVVATARGRLHVLDRGPGVAEEDASRIFDAFARGRRTAGTPGSGLGLALARKVACMHGGTLSHDHRAGGGSVFTLSFLLASDAPVGGNPVPTRPRRARVRSSPRNA